MPDTAHARHYITVWMGLCPEHEKDYRQTKFPAPTTGVMCDKKGCSRGASVVCPMNVWVDDAQLDAMPTCRGCGDPVLPGGSRECIQCFSDRIFLMMDAESAPA